MTEFHDAALTREPTRNLVADLRATLGLTLEAMGARLGISKSQMHEVERTQRASLRVALKLEELADGAIDAAELSDDVRVARHGLADTAAGDGSSPGKAGEISRQDQALRQAQGERAVE